MYKSLKKLIPDPVKKDLTIKFNSVRAIGKTKYFCVGRNKTGTTSVKAAFEDLGFIVAEQDVAETLHDKYFFDGNYEPIIKYCKTGQVFQDVPFSHYELVPVLDKAYTNSKFILTVRDTPEQWYNSITKYHAKQHGLNGRIPTYEDIINCPYRSKGFLKRLTIDAHGTTAEDPYHKETLLAHYQQHNQVIIDYFKDRPQDLLIINLSAPDAYQKFLEFIGVDSPYDCFPWENKT
jgi:hypothetical protein